MSRWLSGAVLLGGLLIGYAATNRPALAQDVRFPLQSGETVQLALDPGGGGFPCVVIDVRGDFIGCASAREAGGLVQHPERRPDPPIEEVTPRVRPALAGSRRQAVSHRAA